MQSRDKCFTLTNHIYYTLHTLTLLFAQIYIGTTCHPVTFLPGGKIELNDVLIRSTPRMTRSCWFRTFLQLPACGSEWVFTRYFAGKLQQEVKLINRKYYNRNSVQPNFYFWQAALLVCLRRQIELVMQNFTSHLFLLFHKNNFLDRPSAVMLHTTDFSI